MNSLNKSLVLALILGMAIVVISISGSMLYKISESLEEKNETPIYAKGGTTLEVEEGDEGAPHIEWVGHSLLSNTNASLQIRYSGPTIEHFDEKQIDFLINGRKCKWYSQISKTKAGYVTVVENEEVIYILVSFECSLKKGDILTFRYIPLGLELQTQL
jgi:hypothetical protein